MEVAIEMRVVSWTCPHCNRPTTIGSDLRDVRLFTMQIGRTRYGELALLMNATRCPNVTCNEVTLVVTVGPVVQSERGHGVVRHINNERRLIDEQRLIPECFYVPQPDYIPEQLRDDYYEACRIRDLSPKAAATLARRCLQGIIRDFWNIKERTLKQEVDALQSTIGGALWDAIDAVRRVGNIGAHMQEDVNKIVDISPEEAGTLIGLVEILFEESYVARHDSQQRLAAVTALGQRKDAERKT